MKGTFSLLQLVAVCTAATACSTHPSEPGEAPSDGGVESSDGGAAGSSGGSHGGEGGIAGSAGSAGSGVSCGMASNSDPDCVHCVDERCCDQAKACAGNPDCPDLVSCQRACEDTDVDCDQRCRTEHSSGYPSGRMLMSCEAHECAEPCQHPDSGACGLAYSDELCNNCAMQQCCETRYSASQDHDYWDLLACVGQCADDDSACIEDCYAQHPSGFAGDWLAKNCPAIACTTECAATFQDEYPCGLYITSDSTCRECAEEKCCDLFQQASLSEDYFLFFACWYACGDDYDCFHDCWFAVPEGAALYFAVASCADARCTSECDILPTWRCGEWRYADPVCDDCWKERCCDEISNFSTSLEGERWGMCKQPCADYACLTQCIADYPDGWALNQLTNVCRWNECPSECEESPPPCGRTFTAMPDCGVCVETHCCAESLACGQDLDCTRLELCRVLNGCELTDTACVDACRTDYPAGVADYDPLHACLTGICATACEGF